MQVTKYMSTPVITVTPETTLAEVYRIFRRGTFRHLPVADPAGRLIGMVTDRDMRSALPSSLGMTEKQREDAGSSIVVEQFMSRVLRSLQPTSTLDDALLLLDRDSIGAVPVIDENRVIRGIFSIRDLLRAYKKLFSVGEKGFALITVIADNQPKALSRITRTIEDMDLTVSRLILVPGDSTEPSKIHIRINTLNIPAVRKTLLAAGFQPVLPDCDTSC